MHALGVAAISLALSGGVAAPGDRATISVAGARPAQTLRLYLVSWHDYFARGTLLQPKTWLDAGHAAGQ